VVRRFWYFGCWLMYVCMNGYRGWIISLVVRVLFSVLLIRVEFIF